MSHHAQSIFFLLLMMSCVIELDSADAQPRIDRCAGVLHRDQYGLRIGGGIGEDEGICVINKSEENKVLAVCTLEHYCSVNGLVDDCKGSGECAEIKNITAAPSALSQNSQEPPSDISNLDSAQLIIRPGIEDFPGVKVGMLWECLNRAPTGASKVVNRYKKNDSGNVVQVRDGKGMLWEFHFILYTSENVALLDVVRARGLSSTSWNDVYQIVLMIAQFCNK